MKKDRDTTKKGSVRNKECNVWDTLEGINNRLYETEDQISVLEIKVEKNKEVEQQKEKRILRNEESLRNILDNIKHNNILIIRIPEEEDYEQRIENPFEEIITENFPNLVKEKVTHVQEAQRVLN